MVYKCKNIYGYKICIVFKSTKFLKVCSLKNLLMLKVGQESEIIIYND